MLHFFTSEIWTTPLFPSNSGTIASWHQYEAIIFGSGIAVPIIETPKNKGNVMRNRYIRLLLPVFVFVLAIIISANIPAGKLLAMQGGGSGSGAVTSGTSDYGTQGSVGNSVPGTTGPGTGSVTGGTTPGATNQAGTDANAGRGLGWGSVILSFIVGLVIGALIFGNRREAIDRDNLRRRAS
jgi:hypothetical protein